MTETFQHPLIHTPDPRQRTIERMAQAGFDRYYAHRHGYTWSNATFPVRKRWEVVAERVLSGEVDTPQKLRNAYCDGIDGAPAWAVRHALHWSSVLSAMRCVIGTSEVAA